MLSLILNSQSPVIQNMKTKSKIVISHVNNLGKDNEREKEKSTKDEKYLKNKPLNENFIIQVIRHAWKGFEKHFSTFEL